MRRLFLPPGREFGMDSSTYAYDSLPKGRYFRYLILHPGELNEALVCDLITCALDEAPPFEALSYVWGSSEKPCHILCNNKTVPITCNLDTALRHVRLSSAPRTLWADSICINQIQQLEQAHQVNFMDEIYRQADNVLICLGPNDNGHAKKLSSLVAKIAKMVVEETYGASQGDLDVRSKDWDFFPWPDKNDSLHQDDRWKSFETLMRHSWFTRGWVAQEAAVAKRAVVLWADAEMKWLDVIRTCLWVFRRGHTMIFAGLDYHWDGPWVHLIAHRLKFPLEMRAFYPGPFFKQELLSMLHHGRLLGFKEERDRVFAFKELARLTSTGTAVVSEMEYNMEAAKIFEEFTRRFFRLEKDANFLSYVIHSTKTLNESQVPSWVLRWDLTMQTRLDVWARVCFPGGAGTDVPAVLEQDDGYIQVRGVLLDRIAHSFDLPDGSSLLESLQSLITSLKEMSGDSTPYGEKAEIENAVLDTLCMGRIEASQSDWSAGRTQLLLTLKQTTDPQVHEPDRAMMSVAPTKDTMDLVLSVVRRSITARRFVVTTRGYYGLCPALSCLDDWYCLVSGANLPLVLREAQINGRSQARNTSYKVIGSMWLTSTSIGTGPSHYMLGSEKGDEWRHWASERDILLV